MQRSQFKDVCWSVWVCVAAIVLFGVIRYAQNPSFWLDEAFVAASLGNPSPHSIFAQLDYGQYFPRVYLLCIVALREIFGYHNPVSRLLPFSCFLIGTAFWAHLLARRSRHSLALCVFGGALLLGSSFWLDQAIQLKQFTFDVMLGLAPFLLSDEFFDDALARGNRKSRLVFLALPCCLSYTYPMALAARVLGWYLERGRRQSWRLNAYATAAIVVAVAMGLATIWLTDHQFNIKDNAAYFSYWSDCILSARLERGIGSASGLIAKFLWGWHGRMPLVTAGMVPLQVLGVIRVIRRWRRAGKDIYNSPEAVQPSRWGSRSLGSLVLIIFAILASALVNYPICAGRAALFAEIHTQILAIEGALFLMSYWGQKKAARIALYTFICVTMLYSVREYVRLSRTEPAENLFPLISMIRPEVSDKLWVHWCAVAQVTTLPGGLPVQTVLLGSNKQLPPPAEKVWVIWAHMADPACRSEMDRVRHQARTWETVYEDSDRGLALAEY